MLKKINDNKGFTLVEMIIVLAIVGIVFSLVAAMVLQSTTLYGRVLKKTNYVNSATDISNTIKSQLNNIKYITIGEDKTSSMGLTSDDVNLEAADGAGRIYADDNYDGIWLQNGTDSAKHMFSQKQLNNVKTKLTFKVDNKSSTVGDDRFATLKIYLAFYDGNVGNSEIAADSLTAPATGTDLALYRHNTAVYISSLAFGINTVGSIQMPKIETVLPGDDPNYSSLAEYIEAYRTSQGYDTADDKQKVAIDSQAYSNICAKYKENEFGGTCIKFK